ncbi:MAG: formaldehyde-activating enzyme [Deltaproteobacteria bacterium]|nr:formaldehyde-activating enzyme [Deltaproteobacteria bacterium]
MSIARPEIEIGEAFVGDGFDAAHVNTVIGKREGTVGSAWAQALATPTTGHAPFIAVLQPGLPVKPYTLFVNKAGISSAEHARMTWGAAQAGVASGVADAVVEGTVEREEVDGLVIIASVWVNPEATDERAVYRNNRDATRAALAAGSQQVPKIDEVLDARDAPENPNFRLG